jgi:hypothetical protein
MEEKRKLQIEWKCPECGAVICQHLTDALNGYKASAEDAVREVDGWKDIATARKRDNINLRTEIKMLREEVKCIAIMASELNPCDSTAAAVQSDAIYRKATALAREGSD